MPTPLVVVFFLQLCAMWIATIHPVVGQSTESLGRRTLFRTNSVQVRHGEKEELNGEVIDWSLPRFCLAL